MGGDHKCPVCQATFTRPQHVARHMRSHTGDRPYKCQYCGDQFARSDLLSRHVNKCHANEKPSPNPSGTRRKGASSATRATTSKQACDQCVQSSLPCDGSNPCAKCVSRKCRCTYIKFHRQTAPVGPGHNARQSGPAPAGSMSSSSAFASTAGSSPRLPLYQHSEDDFILGPAPSSVTMADTFYNSNTFSFPALYPQGSDLNSIPPDYPVKYRAQQPELFSTGRSGLGTGLTPLYDPRQGTNSSWLASWETQGPHAAYAQQPQQVTRQHEYMPGRGPATPLIHDKHVPGELGHHPNPTGSYLGNPNPPNSGNNPPMSISMPYHGFVLPRLQQGSSRPHHEGQGGNSSSSYDSSNSNSRRGSVDFSGSEDTSLSSGPASGSVPCSATSSNVHLPLNGYGNTEYSIVGSNAPDRRPTSATSSNSSHHEYERYASQDERQEFSSAFGLMSLDDPAVIAGISADGQPFFDDPSQAHNQQQSSDPEQNHDGLLTVDVGPDMDTPMPLKRDARHINPSSMHQRPATVNGVPGPPGIDGPGTTAGIGNLPTPSKDADTRELKEVWRQYMRTPLTGPQDAGPASNNAEQSPSNSKTASPTSHRRQRVSSFPSTRTPMVESKDMSLPPASGLGYHQLPGSRGRENSAAMQQGTTSSLRTTLHDDEDLRSYEAAVLARKTPTLNLQLKRPMKGKCTTTGSSQQQQNHTVISGPPSANDSQNASPQMGFEPSPNSFARQSSSSSLANAFGQRGKISVSGSSSRSISGQGGASSPSLPSSRDTSVGAHSTSASSEGELRPSFKRLASQTLGPDNSKRAFFGYDDDVGNHPGGWSARAPNTKPMQHPGFAGVGGCPPVVNQLGIADRRRRRMSAPSSHEDGVGLGPEHVNHSPHANPPVAGGGNRGGEIQPLGYALARQGGISG